MISHDVFVVLDVMWLAGVLKPILDHRGVTKNEMGDKVHGRCCELAIPGSCGQSRVRNTSQQRPYCVVRVDQVRCFIAKTDT